MNQTLLTLFNPFSVADSLVFARGTKPKKGQNEDKRGQNEDKRGQNED
jgi:hypothetical protein